MESLACKEQIKTNSRLFPTLTICLWVPIVALYLAVTQKRCFRGEGKDGIILPWQPRDVHGKPGKRLVILAGYIYCKKKY